MHTISCTVHILIWIIKVQFRKCSNFYPFLARKLDKKIFLLTCHFELKMTNIWKKGTGSGSWVGALWLRRDFLFPQSRGLPCPYENNHFIIVLHLHDICIGSGENSGKLYREMKAASLGRELGLLLHFKLEFPKG